MRQPSFLKCKCQFYDRRGFSLVELMVVLVIIGILAIGVVMSFTDPIARVKAQAFELRGDFNLARAVAVKENEDVLIDFTRGTIDGYQICFDTDGGGDCSDEVADDIIKTVTFREDVQYYDFSGGEAFPANGPDTYPDITPMDAATNTNDGISLNDAIDPTLNNITFISNGSCNKSGSVVIYYPKPGNPSIIRGKPYALLVASASTGKIQLLRWRPEKPAAERWSPK